ncbi:hypothetical protein [Sphingobacterium composti Ten et al. 2007 non Yoo et al. 2007]|uniref:hypothetical protein n=1 Tax=Sphingobacterium composti TaxID=363260 RepID=UPI00135A08F0|nr:hypothetical protein [Sphingobacterium composti Ten et al. 2007 non Yoo et al. 2007]
MKTQDIKINKNKFLSKLIPSNCIFFKNLTGIGATHVELNIAQRNSIVIEPFVPVITGKSINNDKILGVYEGITKKDIVKYLQSYNGFKKIVSTPESFISKVIPAFIELGIDFLNEYFLLIDECDRLTKDVNFREQIIAPMDYFFQFKNKAFVSATALIPTDPRFKENKFRIQNVIPTYNIEKNINVINTNHTLSALKYRLENAKADKVLIFLNSVSGSASIIKTLGIADKSSLFTSTDAVKNFDKEYTGAKPRHLCSDLDIRKFSKYNFLTSRYFSAVDIKIEEMVEIIIVSDVNKFQHSLIDPYADLIQIIGRVRNSYYIGSVNFIVNLESKIDFVEKEEIEKAFEFGAKLREVLKTGLMSTDNEGIKNFIKEFVNIMGDKAFFNDDFTDNHFMKDNFRNENFVKSLYQNKETLIGYLKSLKVRNTDKSYLNVIDSEEVYRINDDTLKLISARKPFDQKYEELIQSMKNVQEMKKENFEKKYLLNNYEEIERRLINQYKEMYEIFLSEGEEKLRSIGNSEHKIKRYYSLNYDNTHLDNMPLIKELYQEFECGIDYNQTKLLNKFHEILIKYEPTATKTLHNLNRFYEFCMKKSGSKRFIKLQKERFNVKN